jgi:alanine racemase
VSYKHSNSTLKINLSAIAENYRILKDIANASEVAAVVKANAYGLGVEKIAPILKKEGCKSFFVANLNEAIQLRRVLPDIDIAVFNGVTKGEEAAFNEYRLIPVLNSMLNIDIYSRYIETNDMMSCFIHVDTGMNRLGISTAEYKELVSSGTINKLNPKLIMSHLSCADEKNNPINIEQLKKFKEINSLSPAVRASLCNSYGVFLDEACHFDLIRPGLALYGGNPCPLDVNPMRNIIEITSPILQIRNIDSNQTVGYGATCELKSGSKIATLPVGYADGYFRRLGNNAYCAINGEKVPVIGRVSMDLITIDITSIKGEVKIGDMVEILGNTIKLEELVNIAGTVEYEFLTSLGDRFNRVYTY